MRRMRAGLRSRRALIWLSKCAWSFFFRRYVLLVFEVRVLIDLRWFRGFDPISKFHEQRFKGGAAKTSA